MRRSAAFLVIAAISLVPAAACRGSRPINTASTKTDEPSAPAADPSAFTGAVAETMTSGGYTYARLKGGKEDVWIATSEGETKTGERLTVALDMPMQNFHSKTLGRTFPLIYFVSRVGRDGRLPAAAPASGAAPSMMASHAPGAVPTTVERVTPPKGGLTIADVWTRRTALAGTEVTVRGQVVKVNEQILDRNWIHLQDGTGSAADRTNDLTVTTAERVKVGDVITVKGVLAADKDFGAGYAYGAILEDAKLIK